jgi:hypothetical protein
MGCRCSWVGLSVWGRRVSGGRWRRCMRRVRWRPARPRVICARFTIWTVAGRRVFRLISTSSCWRVNGTTAGSMITRTSSWNPGTPGVVRSSPFFRRRGHPGGASKPAEGQQPTPTCRPTTSTQPALGPPQREHPPDPLLVSGIWQNKERSSPEVPDPPLRRPAPEDTRGGP